MYVFCFVIGYTVVRLLCRLDSAFPVNNYRTTTQLVSIIYTYEKL